MAEEGLEGFWVSSNPKARSPEPLIARRKKAFKKKRSPEPLKGRALDFANASWKLKVCFFSGKTRSLLCGKSRGCTATYSLTKNYIIGS